MKRKRFTEERIIGILKKAEQAGNIREVCRLHNSTEQTFYRCRNKCDGMDVSEAKKLRELERENTEPKKAEEEGCALSANVGETPAPHSMTAGRWKGVSGVRKEEDHRLGRAPRAWG
jgi:putative transposase